MDGLEIEYNLIYDLKYEGEFLKGKKHGKMKVYKEDKSFFHYEQKLKFEGEYINNCRSKGKEYYTNEK